MVENVIYDWSLKKNQYTLRFPKTFKWNRTGSRDCLLVEVVRHRPAFGVNQVTKVPILPSPPTPPPSPRDLAFAPTTVKNCPISEHRLRRWFGSFTTTRYLTHSPNIVTTSNPLMTTQLFSGNSSRYGTRNWTQPFQWDNNSMEPISFKIRIWPLDMFSNCNIELK